MTQKKEKFYFLFYHFLINSVIQHMLLWAWKCGMESYDYFNFLLTVFSQHGTASFFAVFSFFYFIYFNNRNFKSIITSTTLAVALHNFPFSFVVCVN